MHISLSLRACTCVEVAIIQMQLRALSRAQFLALLIPGRLFLGLFLLVLQEQQQPPPEQQPPHGQVLEGLL